MGDKVSVLIVDDSAYMRVVLKDMLESDRELSVVGTAKDGMEGVEKARNLSPDVVLLDIQMPRMDGIATLQRVMKESPTRVIMLSAMDKVDDQLPLRALELGAVDFISKPSGPVSIDIINFSDRIIEVVKASAAARVEVLKKAREPPPTRLRLAKARKETAKEYKVVVIGASTGGPRALENLFSALPRDLPACILIVQHLPQEFSASFAKRLNSTRGPEVMLASDGARIERGFAYLAPGGRHLKLAWRGATSLMTRLEDSAPVNYVRPSADVLFASAADCLGDRVLAVVLTGMGADGANGARAVKRSGGKVVVQDEQTSVVFGMPKAAVDAGVADEVLPLESIAEKILEFVED
ncbi:MAG: hypothetical protein A3K67_03025 [Euryarchaeota archaeon RBG_16_62_10]|nr:MAG: hypothetical protein A3K67_03025 [Euryarchaeota archaeon RBG_16_62_10]